MIGFLSGGKKPIFAFNESDLGSKGFKTNFGFSLKSNLLATNLSSVLKKRRIFIVLIKNAVSLQLFDSLISKLICQSFVR